MLEEIINQSIIFSVSFIANLFASVSGGGAGFVQFPLLIIMGLPFAQALGTHKVAVVFLGLGAISKHFRSKQGFMLDKQVAIIMLAIGCPSVVAGTYIVLNVPSQLAEITVGIITVASGIYTFFKKQFGSTNLDQRSHLRIIVGALLLSAVGLFSGSLSSGAGLFSTLTLVSIFGLDLKRAILHTMVFVGTLWNIVGAITVGAITAIYWQWIPVMIIATFTGSYLGTTLLTRMNLTLVRICFSSVAIASGITLIYTAFN